MAEMIQPIDDYVKALAARDVDGVVKLYAADAVLVRYEGVAKGPDEIRAFVVGFLTGYEGFDLISLDQVQQSDDMIVWDSTSETGAGVLQMTNVIQLNDDGLIVRHVPLVRGFWGQT